MRLITKTRSTSWVHLTGMVLLLCMSASSMASSGGRILATGGVMSAEGAAGGGVVPWAMLAGYGDERQWGGTAWLSNVRPKDFTLNAYGAAASWSNRIEVSVSQQSLDIDAVASGQSLDQTVFGIKARLLGDLIYSDYPQLSLGLLYKQNDTFTVPQSVGAKRDSDVDLYLAASKLWLDGPFHRSLFVNGTLRFTRGNQMGLLGFGGDVNDDHEVMAEVSTGLFINRHWVVGAEYRQKPNNLSFAREEDWQDVFVGWFPNKRVAVVVAWAGLGSIAGFDNQDSVYLSLQLSQ